MKKLFSTTGLPIFVLLLLTGCNPIGNKETSISVIYGVTSAISLLLLLAYFFIIKNKNKWFIVLFSSVFVVNVGYCLLSASSTLNEALWANRLAYLGSVFLPLSMLMIILSVTKIHIKKWVLAILLAISTVIFLIAASPGYLDIYYKSVSLEVVNGIFVLKKEYGSWHCIYLFYLLSHLIAMLSVVSYASLKKKLEATSQSIMLFFAVLVNIGVWFLEQLVEIDFEFLSVSYIITELFLLGLFMMIQEHQAKNAVYKSTVSSPRSKPVTDNKQFDFTPEQYEIFKSGVSKLTQTEQIIYGLYTNGKSTKEVLAELNIKENTLKYHNKNIYSKLGVSSRKQLIEIAKQLSEETK